MCAIDGGSPEFFVEGHRKARKRRRCCECGAPIPARCMYLFASGKWDGEVLTFSTHVECRELWELVHEDLCGGEGVITFGDLPNELAEYRDSDATEEMQRECGCTLDDLFEGIHAAYTAMDGGA